MAVAQAGALREMADKLKAHGRVKYAIAGRRRMPARASVRGDQRAYDEVFGSRHQFGIRAADAPMVQRDVLSGGGRRSVAIYGMPDLQCEGGFAMFKTVALPATPSTIRCSSTTR
jgi:hypothetical protein